MNFIDYDSRISFEDVYSDKIDLSIYSVLKAVLKSSIEIERKINCAALINLHGIHEEESKNSTGDLQKKLDIVSNEIMIENLKETGFCSALLSEENEDAIILNNDGEKDCCGRNKFIVSFDPLDGSSNIDCNCCIGTIFAIYCNNKNNNNDNYDVSDNFCRKGSDIICAGYVLYGPACELVLTIDHVSGVQKFTLDRKSGVYYYTGDICLTDKTKKIYCINEANCELWHDDMKNYISLYKKKGTKYTQRYIGSMVADVHRTLLYGGMFCYPTDKKNKSGKLRLVYECGPMAKIVESAGGMAITADQSDERILDILPTGIHQRTGILLGSKEEVHKYIEILHSKKNK